MEVALRRVLLLNITYEPLTTVCLHRAVGLVLAEKAEIVHGETSGRELHSVSVTLAAPSVMACCFAHASERGTRPR